MFVPILFVAVIVDKIVRFSCFQWQTIAGEENLTTVHNFTIDTPDEGMPGNHGWWWHHLCPVLCDQPPVP